MSRYKFYKYDDKATNSKVTVCVSHFAGKPVYGRAKCDLNQDAYDEHVGEELAALRVDVKVAEKKVNRAQDKIDYWSAILAYAQVALANAKDYYEDAEAEFDTADACLTEYEASLR